MSTGGGGAVSVGGIMAEMGLDDAEFQRKMAEVKAAIDKAADAYIALDNKIKSGAFRFGPELDAANARLGQLSAGMGQLNAEMVRLETEGVQVAASVSQAGASLNRTAGSAGGATRAFLELSRGVEDFSTGGFIGILNNIPGIMNGIGAAAGVTSAQLAALTGGVSLLATGAYLLYRNWDQLEALLGSSKVMDEADEMDKLAKATARTADETSRLIEMQNKQAKEKAGTAAFNALPTSATPEDDRTRAEAVKKAVADIGGSEAVVRAMLKKDPNAATRFWSNENAQAVYDAEAKVAKAKKELAGLKPGTKLATEGKRLVDEARKGVTDARATANYNASGEMRNFVGNAGTGGEADIRALMGRLPAEEAQRFQEALDAPAKEAGKKIGEALDKTGDWLKQQSTAAVNKQAGKIKQAEDKARQAADKQAAELNREGEHNEALTLKLAKEQDPALYRAMLAKDDPGAALAFDRQRAEDERKRKEKEAADAVEGSRKMAGAIPGIEGLSRAAVLRGMGAADPLGEATETIKGLLKDAGIEGPGAHFAAAGLAKDAAESLDKLTADAMGGGEGPKRSSATMDSLGYAHAIQGGVGIQDEARKQSKILTDLLKTNQQLLAIERNRQNGVFPD